MIEILLLGFLIGLWHAMNIDHIAAIITFIAVDNSSRLRSVVYGLIWGLGHATMLMIVVLAVMTLKLQIGDEFAWLMEFLVAVMLIALALDLFRRLAKVEVHTHEHQHSTEAIHSHVHVHMENIAHAPEHHTHGHYKGYFGRALLVGLMHGSAGSAAMTHIAKSAILGSRSSLTELKLRSAMDTASSNAPKIAGRAPSKSRKISDSTRRLFSGIVGRVS